mmetsp:Transcript_24694/g.51356  ORF Transcript_24694/g.51356 Transcript_24694/m.51356 type:complete len:228 (+) Transcript_24694:1428-2111(+)
MRAPFLVLFVFVIISFLVESAHSFSLHKRSADGGKSLVALGAHENRRAFLGSAAAIVGSSLAPSLAFAEEEADLTSQLFNEDGSLKEGVESEAKFRSVEFAWDGSADPSTDYFINIDGKDVSGSKPSSETSVKLSYDVPLKWKGPSDSGSNSDLYTDLTEESGDVKALTKITIYQAPGLVKQAQLEKATTIGIAEALKVLPDLKGLASADLVGGRVRTVGSNKQKNV